MMITMPLLSATSQTPGFPEYTSQQVRAALINKEEIALLDVREEYLFAEAHPLFAANLPLPAIEREARYRIPRLNTLIVLYGDAEYDPAAAAQKLRNLGYTHVHFLKDGLDGWRRSGGIVFRDVNSASKAFGELVESRRHTPMLSAREVKELIDAKEKFVILDARRYDEYHTMNIPGGISGPGAELVLRARTLAPDPTTTIIVNCAGRTRSIIGAQSLINAGIPNPVVALRNGTMGWTLDGLELEHRSSRTFPALDSTGDIRHERFRARLVANKAGVKRADMRELLQWQQSADRTTYYIDVRTPAEYETGHIPFFQLVPGGQLVQETDHAVPVRGARIVLADHETNIRANMTASWLAQMGWEVYVLDGGVATWTENGNFLQQGAGRGSIRSSPPAHKYKRPYEGTHNRVEAMQNYLEWEYGLVKQLEQDGTHGFFVLTDTAP